MSINPNKNKNHSYFMQLALHQANKILGNTSVNPAVGCVLVKNNNVIGAECTSFSGRPHAESNVIKSCKKDIKNSFLYSTLEPCSNFGKTGPCTDLIVKNKIKRVFFSIKDPDIRSFNKSITKFKKNGIKTIVGINKKEVNAFYRSYYKSRKSQLPFVTCKLAISKDFFTINKKHRWITNKFSRGRVHLMRSAHDCIITSSSTVNSDNPKLTCRIEGLEDRSPSRIVLDKNLKIKVKSKLVTETGKYKTIIFYNKADDKKIKILRAHNVKFYKIPLNNENDLNLKMVLLKAKQLGFSRIFLECGLKLLLNFFKNNLIDDFKLFISSNSIKKNGLGNFKKYLILFLKNKEKKVEKINLFGDKLISYKIK